MFCIWVIVTATGINLMARWGISLADIRPTQMSVSWTSKTDDELHSCFIAISLRTSDSWAVGPHRDGYSRYRRTTGSYQFFKPRRASFIPVFSKCLSGCLAEIATWQSDKPKLHLVMRIWISAVVVDGPCKGALIQKVPDGQEPDATLTQRDLNSYDTRGNGSPHTEGNASANLADCASTCHDERKPS